MELSLPQCHPIVFGLWIYFLTGLYWCHYDKDAGIINFMTRGALGRAPIAITFAILYWLS